MEIIIVLFAMWVFLSMNWICLSIPLIIINALRPIPKIIKFWIYIIDVLFLKFIKNKNN